MKLPITISLLAGLTFLATPASAENPIFKNHAHAKLDSGQMKSIKGQGTTSDYYGYYGLLYSSYATQYGTMGSYYNDYSSENLYYYYAYSYAQTATNNFYYAWLYSGM
ncbi:hypothetical protein [Microvirga sp. P5_D2]